MCPPHSPRAISLDVYVHALLHAQPPPLPGYTPPCPGYTPPCPRLHPTMPRLPCARHHAPPTRHHAPKQGHLPRRPGLDYRVQNGARAHASRAASHRLSQGRRPWRRSRSAGDAAAITSCCVDVTESRLGARLGSEVWSKGRISTSPYTGPAMDWGIHRASIAQRAIVGVACDTVLLTYLLTVPYALGRRANYF